MKNDTQKRMEKAERRIRCVIGRMKSEMPFLQESLAIFDPYPVSTSTEPLLIYTDGKKLFYEPETVLLKDEETIRKQILHITTHGLCGHFDERQKLRDKTLADAVMDMQAERFCSIVENALRAEKYLAVRYGEEDFEGKGETEEKKYGKDDKNGKDANNSKDGKDSKLVTGLGAYYRGTKDERLKDKILEKRKYYYRDSHRCWIKKDGSENTATTGTDINTSSDEWKSARENLLGSEPVSMIALPKILADIIKASSKKWGSESVDRECCTDGLNKTSGNYMEMLHNLRRLSCVHREEDSPDPIYYSYGMELYEDMPLIEPIDEGEVPALDTIVIAVDTSGSCGRELPKFLAETRYLLQELKGSVDVKSILYVECDAKIHMEKEYSVDDMITFFSGKHSYSGLGGTDFRPVFKEIDEYRRERKKISCLLYYTDGMGFYPEEPADYPCYFVLPGNKDEDSGCIPPWTKHEPDGIPMWINRLWLC